MLDTMTVEAMNKFEAGDQKGMLQSSTWLWGTVGGLIGTRSAWHAHPNARCG